MITLYTTSTNDDNHDNTDYHNNEQGHRQDDRHQPRDEDGEGCGREGEPGARGKPHAT